ncbi:hypothetical protein ACFPVT_06010 [Corynebacterium choanae]|nr:hypothetical protein [Corynebacterium choanae]
MKALAAATAVACSLSFVAPASAQPPAPAPAPAPAPLPGPAFVWGSSTNAILPTLLAIAAGIGIATLLLGGADSSDNGSSTKSNSSSDRITGSSGKDYNDLSSFDFNVSATKDENGTKVVVNDNAQKDGGK